MANKHDASRAKTTVQVRIDPEAVDRIDKIAAQIGRSRSEVINFAAIEWSELTPEEINRRIMRAAKSR